MIETIMSADFGRLYLDGVLLETRGRLGKMVPAAVSMRFERDVQEARFSLDDDMDRAPYRFAASEILSFTAENIFIRTRWNVSDPVEWIPYVYAIDGPDGDVAWIEGRVRLISADERYGSEWQAKYTTTVTVHTNRDGTFPTSPTMMEV